jgi:hypothetical protein
MNTTVDNRWPTEDLGRRVERALDLAEAAIALVSTDSPGIDLEALEAPPNKIIAETAMFLRAALAVPRDLAPNVAERADMLARELAPHARHSRVAIGIALHPALALDYGAAHLVLGRAGYPDIVFDNALADTLGATIAHARERVPHRELEQDWLAWLMGGPAPLQETMCRTALVKGTDLITGSRDDVYALTHSLLYATDFGNLKPRFPQTDDGDVIATARSALAGALDDDDFDLAGELLLTWPFLHADWDDSSSLAFAVLAKVEDDVGVLPSLALDREAFERQPDTSKKSYVAAVTYHTAYVMGLLCSTMLRHDSRAEVVSNATGSPALSELLLGVLKADKRRPQWLRYVETLPNGRQAACCAFLLDVAVRRASRQLKLDEVRDLLQLAIDHRSACSPLCLQAAGLLRRLAAQTFARNAGHR